MQGVVDEFKHQLDKYQREVKRIFKRKEEEVEKIKAFRLQIDRRLDVLEKSSIDEIEKTYQALIKKIADDSCELTTSQQNVNSSHDSIISAGSNTSQQFVSNKRGKTATEKANKCIADKMIEYLVATKREQVHQLNKSVILQIKSDENPSRTKLEEGIIMLQTTYKQRMTDADSTNVCSQCGKTFRQRRNLRTHEKSHAGTFPFTCCDRGFRSRRDLDRHRCREHDLTKNYVCLTCNKTFATSSDLKAHERRENNQTGFQL
ncbi:zinc finger and BTB domain-containing protein 14-like [Mercenaria mercenaria]|uniref:zinc finger and BTB domain-containing protein 14-like n=1 Tax=Mercenaria mercenaria TaxID=6596 RepID=UPI00234E6A64|nr:zinc finger and BTB domain-containing protein 14-like [Mercenaria mercenaria]